MPQPSPEDARLAELLVSKRLVDPARVAECLAVCPTLAKPLSQILTERNYISSETLAEALNPQPISRIVQAVTPDDVKQAAQDSKNIFGKYVILEKIGRGGMGVVHRGWDTELNRPVALKFLLQSEDEEIRRFAREAQTAAALSHPNIIPIYEVGSINDKFFIAMEFIRGRTLDQAKPSPREAARMIRDAATALQYAHAEGVIHRDIKPPNLILREDGRVYVMDFGLARQVRKGTTLTQTGFLVGTPNFMSPEQSRGVSGAVDPRTDIYSLGATLYALVTGRMPFVGEEPLEILQKVVNDEPIPPRRLNPKIEQELENIILKSMAKERDQRYARAADMAEDLDRYLRGDVVSAAKIGTARRVIRKIRKNPLPAIATLLVAMLVVAALLWFAGRSRAEADFNRLVRDAEAQFVQSKYQEALQLFSQAQQIRSGDPKVESRIRAAREKIQELERKVRSEEERRRLLGLAQPKFDKGVAALDDALKDLYRPGADLNRMRARVQESLETFTEAIAIFPDYADAYFGRGRARGILFEYDEAAKDLSRAVELAPTHATARVERGKLAMQRFIEARLDLGWDWNDAVSSRFKPWLDQAKDDFEKAVSIGGTEQKDFFQALLAFAKGDLVECIRWCGASLSRNASQEEVHKLLADATHFGTGQYGDQPSEAQRRMLQECLKHYDEAIRLRVNYYEARIMRANEYHLLNQTARAEEDADAALALRPDDVLGCWMKGLYLTDRGETSKGLEWYERALKAKPDSFASRVNRGVCLFTLKRYPEALADAEFGIKTNPAHYFSWYLSGSVKSKMSDLEGAIADLLQSSRINPGFSSTWFNLGAIYFNTQRNLEAKDAFEKALQRDHPEREKIEAILEKIRERLSKYH